MGMAAKCRGLNFVIVILTVSINVFSIQFYFSTDYEVGMSKFMHNLSLLV